MTTSPTPRGALLTEQLQRFRHAVTSARADLQASQLPPPGFHVDTLQLLEAIAQAGLAASPAAGPQRLALASKKLDAWTLPDLDAVLALVDQALTELVKPG